MTAPVVAQCIYVTERFLETDPASYVSTGVLSQYNDQGILHQVAFFFKKKSPTQENYKMYNQELVVISKSLKQLRPKCEGSAHPIKILTDYQIMEDFMTSKLINQRQNRWSKFLFSFKFKIVYCPGKQRQKPDAFSRMPGNIPPKRGCRKNPACYAKNRKSQQGTTQNFDRGI
jgi:hypothetical protein